MGFRSFWAYFFKPMKTGNTEYTVEEIGLVGLLKVALGEGF
jgi:hypothetical protein